jgi:hypothetical protein
MSFLYLRFLFAAKGFTNFEPIALPYSFTKGSDGSETTKILGL